MKDLTRYEILVTSFLLLVQFNTIGSIHLSGTFDTNDYFKFITRFGIQATDSHKQKNTQGYIYGNISLEKNTQLPANSLIMLTLLDYNYFIDYYANRLVQPATTSCSMMFEKMEKTAFFYECNQKKGTLDFIRRVPCPHDKLCIDEDEPTNVLENFQFTFTINDLNQARFWYVSLVACVRDTKTCQWRHLGDYQEEESDQPINGTLNYTKIYKPPATTSYTLSYNIWLVNGNPHAASQNRFEHQFSYELHDIFEIYLLSFLFYLLVIPLIGFRLVRHFHYMYLNLFAYTLIEATCRLLSLIHNIRFSFDGVGFWFLMFVGLFDERGCM
jgi:hypothetical protein